MSSARPKQSNNSVNFSQLGDDHFKVLKQTYVSHEEEYFSSHEIYSSTSLPRHRAFRTTNRTAAAASNHATSTLTRPPITNNNNCGGNESAEVPLYSQTSCASSVMMSPTGGRDSPPPGSISLEDLQRTTHSQEILRDQLGQSEGHFIPEEIPAFNRFSQFQRSFPARYQEECASSISPPLSNHGARMMFETRMSNPDASVPPPLSPLQQLRNNEGTTLKGGPEWRREMAASQHDRPELRVAIPNQTETSNKQLHHHQNLNTPKLSEMTKVLSGALKFSYQFLSKAVI